MSRLSWLEQGRRSAFSSRECYIWIYAAVFMTLHSASSLRYLPGLSQVAKTPPRTPMLRREVILLSRACQDGVAQRKQARSFSGLHLVSDCMH